MQEFPKRKIKKVAETIDFGMVCFINTDTFETEKVLQAFFDDPVCINIL
jgi:uncharacterized SAM-dependent methyltransferase